MKCFKPLFSFDYFAKKKHTLKIKRTFKILKLRNYLQRLCDSCWLIYKLPQRFQSLEKRLANYTEMVKKRSNFDESEIKKYCKVLKVLKTNSCISIRQHFKPLFSFDYFAKKNIFYFATVVAKFGASSFHQFAASSKVPFHQPSQSTT